MKKILFLALLSLFMRAVQAQTHYRSVFGDTWTSWSYAYHTNTCDFSFIGAYFEHFGGDTIVWNNITYHYIRLAYYQYNWYFDPSANIEVEFSVGQDFGLRESEGHSRLYRQSGEDSVEVLLMDLNWQVGDTIALWNRWIGQSSDITTIDSIFYANGRKYLRTSHYLTFKRGEYPETQDTLYFIEGVGPTLGFAPFGRSDIFVPLLSCHQLNYEEPDFRRYFPAWELWTLFGNCIPPFDIEANYVDGLSKTSVYPNPTTSTLLLNGLAPGHHYIEIYNMFGQNILSFSADNDCITLDISNLRPGVYFLQIDSKGNESLKIIKQ